MSQHQPVPRLDLAPKLRRPLSLWNPLDYLRLLYWVFFFPQALRWYVSTCGGELIPEEKITGRKRWEWLRQNHVLRQFLLQGLVLTVVTSLVLGVIFQIFQEINVLPNWLAVAAICVWTVALLLSSLVVWLFGLAWVLFVVLSLVSVMKPNSAFSVQSYVRKKKTFQSTDILWLWLMIGMPIFLAILIYARPFLAALLLAGFVRLRLENWLFSLPLMRLKLQSGHWHISHVTPIPLLPLSSALTSWLRQDWEKGLYNANQLLAYTFQFIPIVQAINQVLAETPPEQVIFRVVQLAEAPFNWQLVRFASASVDWMDFLWPVFWLTIDEERGVRLDTPARAAAAGFWHLHEKEPAKAIEAFAVVRSLLYGEEMFTLAQTLAAFHDAKEPATIAALQVPAFPKEPLLRPATWEAIKSLCRVVEDVQVVQSSMSRSTRSFALNRAQGELKGILDKVNTLPQAEQGLIVDIAQTWKEALLQVAGEVGEISITKPVTNPYVVGDPVQGNLFVGREDILRQLEELWVMGHQLQSVVLYGHRRMGKTSILLNAANCSGSGVKVAYVNLLSLGDSPQGVGEVLMAISDAISDAVGCTPPNDTDLLNLPYRTFERYLKQVEALLSGGLIVALDEFEKIEELIEAEKIPKDFMGYLRGLVQMSSKVAFAFAGLHTLEEMTADYFQPFFASVIPIHVGFLQPGATRQILANPDEDFPLDYTPEALDQIYTLTAGQPYLVQLVGFQLVRRYNDYVFEQGRPRDPVFTVEDVEAVINDSEFFKRGRYYFDGVWGQAARGASGQQAILRALAPHPDGLSIDELRTQLDEIVGAYCNTPLQEETLQEALKTLTRHDVVKESEGCWQIIVELFRRWVLQS